MKRHSAFTLIELAIVLIVMGILIGGGAKLSTIWFKNNKIKESQAVMNRMVESIEGYAISFGYLPDQEHFRTLLPTLKDSWGKKIRYVVAPELTKEGSICRKKETALIQKEQGSLAKNIAFYLISSGANRNLQTHIEMGSSSWVLEHFQIGRIVDKNSEDRVEALAYDDLVISRNLYELKYLISCKGATYGN